MTGKPCTITVNPRPYPAVLVCLPFAGAGAGFFRQWDPLAPAGLTILPVQLPGREERYADAPLTSVEQAVNDVLPWVIGKLAVRGGTPSRIGLFGHSLGAELAFELSRLLTARGVPITRLLVSGAPGPRDRCVERVSHLDDDAFLEGLRRVSGYRHAAMDHSELLPLMMPYLRADNAMHEDYWAAHSELLAVPITSLRGRDDHLVSAARAAQWAAETTREFRAVEITGGHMYLTAKCHARELLRTISSELERSE
ncbi:MAG TPA: thioesterase domain-containing protein [Streptosporangiaceae bacterium]|nr:thioesterase domain-containing protein [Streptosporangiaceae bacterium]